MSSVKQEMIHGVFWSAIERYSGIIVSLIVSAVLARLITPKDFGTVAVVTVIINFFSIFATMGIFPAIIQRNDLTQKNLNSIFTYSILGGGFLSLLLFCSARKVANFYNDNSLIFICQILSVNLFFIALNMVPNALMAKNKKFRQIAQRTLFLQVFSGIISIIAAYNGLGIYSLLIAPIVTSIGMFLFNMYYYPCRVDFTFDLSPLKKIFSYSAYQFLFEFINFFSRNTDKLIIGKFLNMSALGYYDKSYRLMMLPLQNITFVITPVMLPVFSVLQNDLKELANKYCRILMLLGYISMPISVLCFFCGKELILLFFGNQWEGAVIPFKILSFTIWMQILTSSSGAIFQASNNTKKMFVSGCLGASLTISSFIITLNFWGTITSVAIGYLCAQLINTIQCFYLIFTSLKYSIRPLLNHLIIPMLISVVVFVMLLVYSSLFSFNDILIDFFAKGFLGFSLFFILYQLFGEYDLVLLFKTKVLKRKHRI